MVKSLLKQRQSVSKSPGVSWSSHFRALERAQEGKGANRGWWCQMGPAGQWGMELRRNFQHTAHALIPSY